VIFSPSNIKHSKIYIARNETLRMMNIDGHLLLFNLRTKYTPSKITPTGLLEEEHWWHTTGWDMGVIELSPNLSTLRLGKSDPNATYATSKTPKPTVCLTVPIRVFKQNGT